MQNTPKKQDFRPFGLTKACKDCPFRTDNNFHLTVPRVREICASLERDESFSCHKTLDYSNGDDGVYTRRSMHCAGALVMLEQMEKPNQSMRIGERLGMYDRHALDMAQPIFKSTAEMIQAYKERNRNYGAR